MQSAPSRVTVAATGLALVLALASTAWGWMAPDPHKVHDGKLGISAAGAMSIDDSRADAPILMAPALSPGHAALGTVTIRNHGDAGYLFLGQRGLAETAPAGGAGLASALRLTIREADRPGRPLVYSGPLTAMPRLRLGRVPSAGIRRYRFSAYLPEPGRVDNSLAGARVRFDLRWRIKPRP